MLILKDAIRHVGFAHVQISLRWDFPTSNVSLDRHHVPPLLNITGEIRVTDAKFEAAPTD
jgi:hypothetical protein